MIPSTPLQDIRIGTIVPFNKQTPDYLREILPYGFECFQLSCSTEILSMDLEVEAERIREVLDGSGAVISSFFHGANPMGDLDKDKESIRTFEKLIDQCGLFGVNIVAGFTGRVRGASIPDSLQKFHDVWRPLADRAGEQSVKIAFENCSMGGHWQSGDWNIAHSPAAWELMFDAIPDAHVGLEWEPCHQMVLCIDPMPQLRQWCHRIFHIHGKDATIHRDVLQTYGIESGRPWGHHRTPGFGDSNWTEIISELKRHGFKGCLDIEGWHDPVYVGELEMTGQVHALRYLKQCRGLEFIPNPKAAS